MAGSSNSRKGKSVVEGNKTVKEILFKDELQLEFILNVGIVKDSELSMPYRTKLSNDKWNLFLPVQGFEDILLGFLKEGEDVREAISVTVYDKGGHEFDMMLKKWVKDSNHYYVLNRGWFSFCDQQCLGENDLVALRTFRHAKSDMLSFIRGLFKNPDRRIVPLAPSTSKARTTVLPLNCTVALVGSSYHRSTPQPPPVNKA
ncbi:hypothetical protein JHK85_001870 [Glycine max]|nr:hypothetical protein JHK85_001870 [Glycine max]